MGLPWDLGPHGCRIVWRYAGESISGGELIHLPAFIPGISAYAQFVWPMQYSFQVKDGIIEGETVGAALGFEGVDTMSGYNAELYTRTTRDSVAPVSSRASEV